MAQGMAEMGIIAAYNRGMLGLQLVLLLYLLIL